MKVCIALMIAVLFCAACTNKPPRPYGQYFPINPPAQEVNK
ncbi:hypothetical protein [Neisseria sp. Ec49-e6-T10]